MTTPRLTVSVRGKGRHYDRTKVVPHPDGDDLLYPSVTNILGCIDKPAIAWWQTKGALAAAWEDRQAFTAMSDVDAAVNAYKSAAFKSRDKKADVGTDVHAVAEALAGDRPIPSYTADAKPYIESFLEWVGDFDVDFLALERTVFSDEHRYAGTYDLLATINNGGRVILGDLKTGKGVYPETSLQLAALRWAEVSAVPDGTGWRAESHVTVDDAYAIHLRPDGYRMLPVAAGPDEFQAFLGCRALWEFHKGGGSDGAVGQPVENEGVVA